MNLYLFLTIFSQQIVEKLLRILKRDEKFFFSLISIRFLWIFFQKKPFHATLWKKHSKKIETHQTVFQKDILRKRNT